MNWKKIAPWNWFKDEQPPAPTSTGARAHAALDPLGSLRAETAGLLDAAFNRALLGGPSLPEIPSLIRPNVDISEGKKAYTVRAELPGIQLENVSIEAEGHTLVISAEKRQEREEEDESYHRIERSYGSAQRVLSLPDDAEVEAIEAKFKNGVLKLRIPKHPARASSGRRIEIQED